MPTTITGTAQAMTSFGVPVMGIKLEVDDSNFTYRINRANTLLTMIEKHMFNLERASVRSAEARAKAAENASKRQRSALRGVRWQLVTFIYFMRTATRIIQAAWESMGRAVETQVGGLGFEALATDMETSSGRILQSMRDVQGGAFATKDLLKVAQTGMLHDQGYFSEQYGELWESARVAAAVSGKEAADIFTSFIQSLVEGTGKTTDAIIPFYGLQVALDEYAASIGTTAEELDRYVAAQVMLDAIQGKTNDLLESGAGAALKAGEGFTEMKAAASDLWDYMSSVMNMGDFFAYLAKGFEAWMWIFITGTGTMSAGIDLIHKQLTNLDFALAGSAEKWQYFHEQQRKYWDEARTRMGYMPGEAGGPGELPALPAKKGEQAAYDRIAEHLMKREELWTAHGERLEDIDYKYEERKEKIWSGFYRREARITRDAQRQRARAERAAARRTTRDERDHNRRLEQELEKHLMKMRHRRHRFRQRELQNDAMYQYERGLAVAEGDVLAIEDLDARHELEKKANKDSFTLQMDQYQEAFELQQEYRKEAFRQEMKDLQSDLDERLKEINDREQEALQEAKDRRQEDLDNAKENWERQREAQEVALKKQYDQWSDHWRDVAEAAKVGTGEIGTILYDFYGPGGDADDILGNYFQRHTQYLNTYNRVLRSLGKPSAWDTPIATPSPIPIPRGVIGGYQFGGSFIASRKQMISVGESPERVTVQPLSSLGGSMTLQWRGGAIPVHGTGTLSGQDLTGVGDAIAQGLVGMLSGQLNNYQ